MCVLRGATAKARHSSDEGEGTRGTRGGRGVGRGKGNKNTGPDGNGTEKKGRELGVSTFVRFLFCRNTRYTDLQSQRLANQGLITFFVRFVSVVPCRGLPVSSCHPMEIICWDDHPHHHPSSTRSLLFLHSLAHSACKAGSTFPMTIGPESQRHISSCLFPLTARLRLVSPLATESTLSRRPVQMGKFEAFPLRFETRVVFWHYLFHHIHNEKGEPLETVGCLGGKGKKSDRAPRIERAGRQGKQGKNTFSCRFEIRSIREKS